MSLRTIPAVLLSMVLLATAACGSDEPVKGKDKVDVSVGTDAVGGEIKEDVAVSDVVEDTTVADVAETTDTGDKTDVAEVGPDVGEDTKDASACPGGDGCSCADNGACDSGVCLDTHEGKKCAEKCTDSCSAGYACKDIGEGNPLFYCVSTQVSLCAPCKFDSECKVNGIDSLCINYGTEGQFCGSPCAADADCPTGYACDGSKDVGGSAVKQCKRKAVGAAAATCECSDWAKAKGLETECAVSNDFGSCKANRKCSATGLSECTAKTPASEVCNQLDDDCDGATDNLAATLGCTVKAFEDAGSKIDCKSDGDCKTAGEACEPATGKCKVLIGACPGKPVCNATGKLECTEASTPSAEVCNGEDDDCDGTKDEGFEFEAAGGKISVGEACGAGACAGGTVVCTDKATSACSTGDKGGTETCDGVDNDCNGLTDDGSCDDKDACTTDACNGATKKCTNTPGADCDDKDDCTVDSCDTSSGTCKNIPSSGSCDDGDQCTVGDICTTEANKAVCTPGKDQMDCDDKNPCTDDTCSKKDGCAHTANSGEVECYNGAKNTAGVGICKKGKQFCKNGKMLAACEGEVMPAKTEACDSVDDDCDGKTDEGCKPTDVAVTFAAARVQGKTGKYDLEMLVGRGAPAGKSDAAVGGKTSAEFGFYAWLQALLK
jgi:hypothetical protein